MPLLVLLTKGDKLSQREKREALQRFEREKVLSGTLPLLYSIKEGKCREALIHEVNKALWDS